MNKRWSGLGIYTVTFLIFLYLPALLLLLFSINDAIYVAFPIKGFTLQWYREALTHENMLRALGNSIRVGACVAIVSTCLGLLAAQALTRYRIAGAKAVMVFLSIPLVIPLLILGISLLVILTQMGVALSLSTIGLGHVVITIPVSLFVLMSRLEGFDRSIEEAALDLGETRWMTFWRVTFPVALPGIVASLLLTFTLSFDEFLLAFFLAGDQLTLPIYIWSQLRFPARLPGVLALGSMIIVATFLLVFIAEWIRRAGRRGRK
uniref:Spermidine/putrescine transport system permease protein n=1 Tax=Candidatus Kentrum sp. FW TaxID=2126338 RepID=A0A450TSJ6_9GAMM|nr:MAG: spermidine/putrescine transport system permease protein [Candidatus Kentron sp. FW]